MCHLLQKGTVIDVQVFTRDGVEKDTRARRLKNHSSMITAKILKEELRIFEEAARGRISNLLDGQKLVVVQVLKPVRLKAKELGEMSLETLLDIQPADEETADRFTQIAEYLVDKQKDIDSEVCRENNANYLLAMTRSWRTKNRQGLSWQ